MYRHEGWSLIVGGLAMYLYDKVDTTDVLKYTPSNTWQFFSLFFMCFVVTIIFF